MLHVIGLDVAVGERAAASDWPAPAPLYPFSDANA
jgi:hypothetical protein